MKRVLGGTGAAIAAKIVTGFAVAALAAATATAAAETAITGSINPNDWGKQVVAQVQKCKAALASGERGIGQCVSAFASQHGAAVSASHHSSDARTGTDNGKGNGGKNHGKGNNGGGGNSSNDGSGSPSDKGHGRPTPTPEPAS